jgi:O-antigen/teichoic acid export membrane protein
VFIVNLTPFAVVFGGIVACYLIGRLTVATAAISTMSGSLLSIAPGLPLFRSGRPVFRPAIAREATTWGVKSWVGGVAMLTNARLDQFLMITAVAPRELGLYAVAVTISGASGLASGAVSPPLMARIGAGETSLMSQAVRIMLAATVVVNVVLVIIAPVLLAVLFGPQFRDAYPMALILLAAQIPLAGAQVLSSALQADGAPLIPTCGEGIAVVITVSGLAIVLPTLGGLGAAIVSLCAYGASFVFQVVMAHRRTGIPLAQFLVPSRADAAWARERFSAVTGALSFGH